MKKLIFALIASTLSVFSVNALPNPNGNDSITTDSITKEAEPVKASLDAIQVQISSAIDKMDEVKIMFGDDIDKLNVKIAIFTIFLTIAGLVIAFISYKFTKLDYEASKRTADNVMRASLNVLEGQFNDLIRHLYRNLVCTLAFSQKILESASDETEEEEKKIGQYPSEEHLLKLKILSEDALHLEKYNNDPEIYQKMHELKLLFRNYDVEIDTTLMHLKNRNMKLDEVKNDLDTLVYKPLHLIEAIRSITGKIMAQKNGGKDYDASRNAASIMTREHISKVDDWTKTRGGLGAYTDLAKIVPPFIEEKGEREKEEKPIPKPYDGLRRSRNRLFDNAKVTTLSYEHDIFTSEDKAKDKDKDYQNQIDKICGIIHETGDFKNNILKQYDFKKYFLTMLSIDVTIELEKIHMIDIK